MWFLPISIIVFTIVLAIPLSRYLAWIMDGRYRPWKVFGWFERRLDSGPQSWKQYTASLLIFNLALFVYGFVVLTLQPRLPLNPQQKGMLSPTTIFHSAVSFLTNTDLQHYSGDEHLSNFSQIFFCILMFLYPPLLDYPRCGHYPGSARGSQCRQFLCRYVAGDHLHVSARRLCREPGVLRQGMPMTYQSTFRWRR